MAARAWSWLRDLLSQVLALSDAAGVGQWSLRASGAACSRHRHFPEMSWPPIPAHELLARSMSDGVATLRLNRRRNSNALSEGLLDALRAGIDKLAREPSLRCVVLEAAGRAFCAGHDLREMRSQPRSTITWLFRKCGGVMQGLQALPVRSLPRCAASPPRRAASW